LREARKKGKKALKKVMKRRERERRKREREAAEESKQDAKSVKDAKYRKKIEEREMARLKKENALKKAMQEKEEQEQKEYESMKSMFEIEESGNAVDETSKIDTSNWLQEFVDYIKLRKVVVIEDIAAEFQLRSKEVVERIESLERMGRVTGVVDDRGKFIYIMNQEMQKVADFIRERGRISLADLAVQSNFLVDLEPKQQEFEDNELEENGGKKEEEEEENKL